MRLHGQAREALRGCPERRPLVSGRPWALYAASGGHPSPEPQGRRALHRPQKHRPSRVGAGVYCRPNGQARHAVGVARRRTVRLVSGA